MKIYRVIDNGTRILTTTNELEALRAFYKAMQKQHDQVANWGWIDTEVLE